MDILVELVKAVLPGLVVGIVMAYWNRKQKAVDTRTEEVEAARVRGEQLKLSLLVATAQLSYATTMAMKRGHTNGEVEPAVAQYEKAMHKFREFEREQLAKIDL